MESLTNLLNKLTLNKFDQGSQHWVNVMHINDPSNFYVRLTDYDSYIPVLEEKGEQLKETEIHIRSEVVYKSKTMGSYVRGQVINTAESYIIFAQDYGCVDKDVPLEYICKPFYEHQTPPLAVLCTLSICKPVKGPTWSEDSIDAMKVYVKKERAKMIVQCITPNKLEVELINTCPDDIGTLLIKSGYSSFGINQQDISRASVPSQPKLFYKYKDLAIGNMLHVRLQKGKTLNEFYVAQIDEYKEYVKRREDFNGYAVYQKSLSLHEIKVEMPVAVQSNIDFKYERGIITNIVPEKSIATVYLIDCGSTMSLSVSLIKPIQKEVFFMSPAISIYCTIDKNQMSYDLHKYLIPGKEFLITIKEIGDKYLLPYVVDISPVFK